MQLTYVVENVTRSVVYLFNRLYKDIDQEGRFVIEPNLCTIEVRETAVHIGKKIFPVPPDILVESENVPCVTELEPGGAFEEQVHLSLPLTPWNPYLEDDRQPKAERRLPVHFEVGYFLAVPATRELVQYVPTTLGDLMRFDPFPVTSQLIVEVGPSKSRVGVLF